MQMVEKSHSSFQLHNSILILNTLAGVVLLDAVQPVLRLIPAHADMITILIWF